MNIDWSRAPDWANELGTNAFGEEAWIGDAGYSYLIGNGGVVSWSYETAYYRGAFLIVGSRPVPWTGEGLPPVGTVCAVLNSNLGNATWERCTILYSGKHRVMYDSESCEERVAFIEDLKFRPARPVRPPEQIAADERDRARTEILNAMTADGRTEGENEENWQFRMQIVGEMLDMGYRKKAPQ